MDKNPPLMPCPFCGSKMLWIDTSKDFTADCFLCGAKCSNDSCVARITFDFHNYSRSQFAKKFNRRVNKETEQISMFDADAREDV